MSKQNKEKWVPQSDVVRVVGDAGIAGQVAEGFTIPLLILDTSERPDIDEIIRVHAYLSPGDVMSSWAGIRNNSDLVALILNFVRPVVAQIAVCFSIEKQAILVDAALNARAMYIQAGRAGDRYIHDPDKPKILIELPEGDFHSQWESIFLRRMTDHFSKELKLSRKKAYPVAQSLLDQMRLISHFQINGGR